MFKLSTLTCVCLMTFTGFAHSADRAGTIKVDSTFSPWGYSWQGGTKYRALVAIKNIGGRIAFCGVGHLSTHSLSRLNREALADHQLLINKRIVLTGFSFFANARSEKALKSSKAKCKFTTLKASQIGTKPIIDIESIQNRYRN